MKKNDENYVTRVKTLRLMQFNCTTWLRQMIFFWKLFIENEVQKIIIAEWMQKEKKTKKQKIIVKHQRRIFLIQLSKTEIVFKSNSHRKWKKKKQISSFENGILNEQQHERISKYWLMIRNCRGDSYTENMLKNEMNEHFPLRFCVRWFLQLESMQK